MLRRIAHSFAGALLLSGSVYAQGLPPLPPVPVTVTNTSKNPVPTAAQGTTQVSGSVNVNNASGSPVPVFGVESFASNDFQTTALLVFNDGDFAEVVTIPAAPAGKLLIIDFVTVNSQLPTGQKVRLIFFTQGTVGIQHFFAPTKVGTDVTNDILSMSLPTRMSTGTTLMINATRFDGTGNQGTGFVAIGISGHLVPIVP
jgi:hypothetical protein